MSSIENILSKLRESRKLHEREDYSKYSVEELVKLAQDGDDTAAEYLIVSQDRFLNIMSKKYILNNSERDDVKQLVTMAFWDAVQKFDGSGEFLAFAGMTIKRKMTDELRKASAEKRRSDSEASSLDEPVADDGEGGSLTVGDTLASEDPTPEQEYTEKERYRRLLKYMEDSLSDREMEVVKRKIRGQKIPQISEEMGLSYKSVENTLMRIRNKLNDYIRSYRESTNAKCEDDITFTDEEKQILESIISTIERRESIREAAVKKLSVAYENYTEEQLEQELYEIAEQINDIASVLPDIYYDDRDEYIDMLEGIVYKLDAMEEYLSEDLYELAQELRYKAGKAEETEYQGPYVARDPYKEIGMSRWDFL